MSYYYKFNFVSPEPVYATVKEELKSYFDTGAVDDLMFPTYLDKSLKKLGRTTYTITETPLQIENFQARLPDNYIAAREAWMCTVIPLDSFQEPGSLYTQASTCTTLQITPITTNEVCINPLCETIECGGCTPEVVQGIFKTNGELSRAYTKTFLLKPGNISPRRDCPNYNQNWMESAVSFNPNASRFDSFDIRDNKIITNFRDGLVHLVFYTEEYDEIGNQMMPDNYRIREYLELFLKYKIFETLSNQTNDETFNQLQLKMQSYKQQSDEAYIIALTEVKKQDSWTKQRRIKKSLNRHNRYKLPNRSYR
jgi:hypothetical protein